MVDVNLGTTGTKPNVAVDLTNKGTEARSNEGGMTNDGSISNGGTKTMDELNGDIVTYVTGARVETRWQGAKEGSNRSLTVDRAGAGAGVGVGVGVGAGAGAGATPRSNSAMTTVIGGTVEAEVATAAAGVAGTAGAADAEVAAVAPAAAAKAVAVEAAAVAAETKTVAAAVEAEAVAAVAAEDKAEGTAEIPAAGVVAAAKVVAARVVVATKAAAAAAAAVSLTTKPVVSGDGCNDTAMGGVSSTIKPPKQVGFTDPSSLHEKKKSTTKDMDIEVIDPDASFKLATNTALNSRQSSSAGFNEELKTPVLKLSQFAKQELQPSPIASWWTAAIEVLGCSFNLMVQIQMTTKAVLKSDSKGLKVDGKTLTFDIVGKSIKTKTGRFIKARSSVCPLQQR